MRAVKEKEKSGGPDFVRELTIKYRKRRILKKEKFCVGETVGSSMAEAGLFDDLRKQPVEMLYAIYLNNQNIVESFQCVSKGGPRSDIAPVAIIFVGAILSNASSVIIVHNHPSGCSHPSLDDRKVTKKVYEAGELLAVKLIDHVILGNDNHYSFANEGEIPRSGKEMWV